jgi:prolyl 3-hydroxylase /prolyl 3,4-dihydroxylase
MSNLLKKITQETIEALNESYKTHKELIDLDGISLYHEPYTHCIIDNLLNNEQFQQELKQQLLELKFKKKNNDLYKFCQTNDLKKCKKEAILKFKNILYGNFLSLLKQITNINLSSEVIDMTSSKYSYSDYLLCHDDDIQGKEYGRRIAFIYYLIDNNWSISDGGALDLFNINNSYEPIKIVKSLVPLNNRLVFFEVSDRSYHQVAEVLTKDKIRLSIHGWFHGPVNLRPERPLQNPFKTQSYLSINDDLFFEWIIEKYIEPFNQSEIQEKFGNSSEIKLNEFFNKEKFNMISEDIKSNSIKWINRGARNRQNYDIADEDTLPNSLKQFLQILKSDYMGLLLSNLTGLSLHSSCRETKNNKIKESLSQPGTSAKLCDDENNDPPVAKKTKLNTSDDDDDDDDNVLSEQPSVYLEVRRWSHGSYSLVTDDDTKMQVKALDVMIFLNCLNWKSVYGGCVTYIAKDEDETLLSIVPEENCLTLVYRDTQTLKFTKYLNTRMKENSFDFIYEIALVFYE